MKKIYLSPELRVKNLWLEFNFLTSPVEIGGSGGEDLDDPTVVDPWS